MTSKNADMLHGQCKSGLQAPTGLAHTHTKKTLLPCHLYLLFHFFSSPSLGHSHQFLIQLFSSVHMQCIYPLGLGEGSCHRVKCFGKCGVPCQEKRNSRVKCVCVCLACEANYMSPIYAAFNRLKCATTL